MIFKYFSEEYLDIKVSETMEDKKLEEFIYQKIANYTSSMYEMTISVALKSVWELISRTNKYIDETEPWKLAKDETKKDRLGNVMAHLAESLRVSAVLLQPFLTEAPSAIFYQLGI